MLWRGRERVRAIYHPIFFCKSAAGLILSGPPLFWPSKIYISYSIVLHILQLLLRWYPIDVRLKKMFRMFASSSWSRFAITSTRLPLRDSSYGCTEKLLGPIFVPSSASLHFARKNSEAPRFEHSSSRSNTDALDHRATVPCAAGLIFKC